MPDVASFDPTSITPTERLNPRTVDIDGVSTLEMLNLLNAEDATVPAAVAKALPQLAQAVERIADGLDAGGRLLYFGAGTSGRLAVLDASECPPTFGTRPEQVQAFIAGGEPALRHAIEGAEDCEADGRRDCRQGLTGLSSEQVKRTVAVGLSASGGAAYVLGALDEAKTHGCYTVSLTCNPTAPLHHRADLAITIEVGPEAVAGSTRLKAGTAQKLALNMLTTGAMIRMGKTYQNWMVDVQPTNRKLRDRARRIVEKLGKLSAEQAEAALAQSGHRVKPAVLMGVLGLSLPEAEARLRQAGGRLRIALESTG